MFYFSMKNNSFAYLLVMQLSMITSVFKYGMKRNNLYTEKKKYLQIYEKKKEKKESEKVLSVKLSHIFCFITKFL